MLCILKGIFMPPFKKYFRSKWAWPSLLICINAAEYLHNQRKIAFTWENNIRSLSSLKLVFISLQQKYKLSTYILKVTCYSITFAKRLIWSSETVLLVLPGVLVGSEPSASTLGQTFKSCIPWRNILQGKMQNRFSKFKIIQMSGIKVREQLQENEVASFAKPTNVHCHA